jgi:hypothetical protein
MEFAGYTSDELKALEMPLKRTIAALMGVDVVQVVLTFPGTSRLRERKQRVLAGEVEVVVTITGIEGPDKQAEVMSAQEDLKTDPTARTNFRDQFTAEVVGDDGSAEVPAAFALKTVGEATVVPMTQAPTSFPTGVPTMAPTHEEGCPFGQFMGVCIIWLGALGGALIAILFCFCCCMMRKRTRRKNHGSEWEDASTKVDEKFNPARPSQQPDADPAFGGALSQEVRAAI